MFIKSRYVGVTLLELLVGFSILIVLTLISIPSFVSLIKNHRIAGAAEVLYFNLQLARTEAVKRNMQVYVSFVSGDNWCYGINTGSSCDCTLASNCNLGAVSASSTQQLSLSAVGYGAGYVSFESSHGAANNAGSLTFTLYGGSSFIRLNIGKLGNVQMCSTGIGGYSAC